MTFTSGDGIIILELGIDALTITMLIFFMQLVTSGAGFRCPMALLILFHRLCYCIAIFAVAFYMKHIVDTWRVPTIYMLAQQVGWMVLCVGSYLRHRLSPAIPDGATWTQRMRIYAALIPPYST